MAERLVEEQATGCRGVGDYRDYAEEQGYEYVEVLNWTSSAGDWDFVVSKDGFEWYIMSQENNWPRPGFTRTVDKSRPFFGTPEEVFAEIEAMYG